jgi:hypothetical protein
VIIHTHAWVCFAVEEAWHPHLVRYHLSMDVESTVAVKVAAVHLLVRKLASCAWIAAAQRARG